MNSRVLYSSFALLSLSMFSSCLKDKPPGSEDYSKSPALVGFQFSGFSQIPITAAILGTPQDSISLEVTLSVSTLTLGNPVNVTIASDQASLDTYNADTTRSNYPTTFIMLPSDQFSIQNGGKITINPGQQIVSFKLSLSGDKIDFTQDYAVPLKITDAQGATIATNLDVAIVLVKAKSLYEGDYSSTGFIYRYNGGTEGSGLGDPPSFEITGSATFSTVTPDEIEGALPIPGFSAVTISLTVNMDNSVTIGPSPSNFTSDIHNTPGKPSTFDPATNTFDLHGFYINGAGALREFDAVLVLE